MLELSIIILAIAVYLGLKRIANAIEYIGGMYEESEYDVRAEGTSININYTEDK